MGLTQTGYRRRTFEEILNAKITKAKELFGEDINTEGNTPLGKYIRINAYDQYAVEELAEKIYYSLTPQTSMGQTLDRHGWKVGMTRNAAIPAMYKVKLTGTAGTLIEYGFLVGTETALTFYNTEETPIGENGTCEIIVECTEAGIIGNVAPSDINQIVNPSADIDDVIGISLVQVGEQEESDYDFIKRYEVVREGKGSCNESAIISAITKVPTVQGAYIIVNESATETVDDIPPKTIACFVDGGANYHADIAEAIFDKKPIGVGTYGDCSEIVKYGGLHDYVVSFSHAKTVDVYVNITLITDASFGADGNEEIKANLISHINSLGISKKLVTTALYSEIYSVIGVVSALVEVSTDGDTYNGNDITVEPYESCSFKQISINGTVV